MKKITVLGSGAMGTAIAKVLHDAGQKDILIYGINEKELEELEKGYNTAYFLNSVEMPSFKTSNNLQEAVKDADYLIVALPSNAVAQVVNSFKELLKPGVLVINVSKGFYAGTTSSLHEGIQENLKSLKEVRGVVSITGPSHAEEIVLGLPTAVSVVNKDKKLASEIQQLFTNKYFRTYIQTDVRGAEVGSSFKNVLAIASGISSGLGFGINATAALLTRGIKEMRTFNKLMKGKEETIMGLTGIGDLIVTATSDLSRNFTYGKKLATDKKAALEDKRTIEGLIALDYIKRIADSKNIELPIINLLDEIINKNAPVEKAMKVLFDRDLKEE